MKKFSTELAEEIKGYKPARGAAAFWWLGQLGYVVKTASVTLCFDAYLSPDRGRKVRPLFEPAEVTFADFIFGSHDHLDHIDRRSWPGIAIASPNARFVAPEKFVGSLSADLNIDMDRFIGLDDEKTFRDPAIPDFKIRAIAAAHEFLDPDPITGLHDSLGYIVDADGVRIYHSGDTCIYEGLETRLKNSGPIDLMFLPINGRDAIRYSGNCLGNMGFAEAVDLAGAVAPRLAVPGHYEMFGNNSEDPSKFMDYLAVKFPGQKAWLGAHGEFVDLLPA